MGLSPSLCDSVVLVLNHVERFRGGCHVLRLVEGRRDSHRSFS